VHNKNVEGYCESVWTWVRIPPAPLDATVSYGMNIEVYLEMI